MASDPFRGAPTEHQGQRFVLVDVSALLPRSPTKSYPARTQPIGRVFVHQTYGGRRSVPEALIDEAEYFLAPRSLTTGIAAGRGWPGFAYTFWVPFAPLADSAGRSIVYRCQPDGVVSNHTWGGNESGVAVAFQGTFANVTAPAAGPPSHDQLVVFPELLAYLLDRYGLTPEAVLPHSAMTKPACPGFELERQINLLKESAR